MAYIRPLSKQDESILQLFIDAKKISGLTQKNIADNLGCSQSAVHNILTGKNRTWLRYLPKTLEFLRCCGCSLQLSVVLRDKQAQINEHGDFVPVKGDYFGAVPVI